MTRLEGWRARIAAAQERGSFTFDDGAASVSWCSCAIGEARELLPLRFELAPRREGDPTTAPTDDGFETLGMEFWRAVRDNDIKDAYHVLGLIEASL